jgi:hypothetical protein
VTLMPGSVESVVVGTLLARLLAGERDVALFVPGPYATGRILGAPGRHAPGV